MNRLFLILGITFVAIGLTMAGCAPSAQQVTPTKAPAAPIKPAEPTSAPAAKVDYPQKGKAVTVIVPFAAGGTSDIGARILMPQLEKELGVPLEVVNKAGAGAQAGMTDMSLAKPDGYTVGIAALPTANATYLDPERKAVYGRKDFQTVAVTFSDVVTIAVKADSPYKSIKDLIDAAKANPGGIKAASSGLMSVNHIAGLQLEKAAGVKFAFVQFSGGGPAVTALLGGHVDFEFGTSIQFRPHFLSGAARLLAIMDSQDSKFLPKVPTLESQGYKVYGSTTQIVVVPAAAPKEIAGVLSAAIKKTLETDELKKWAGEQGWEARYMDPTQSGAFWDNLDAQIKPLIEEFKK